MRSLLSLDFKGTTDYVIDAGHKFGLCEGDCDSDSDCQPGLRCFQRDDTDSVPGCAGGGSDDNSDVDYCIMSDCPNGEDGYYCGNNPDVPSQGPTKDDGTIHLNDNVKYECESGYWHKIDTCTNNNYHKVCQVNGGGDDKCVEPHPEPTDPSVVGLLTELSGGSPPGEFDHNPDNFNLFLALVEKAGLTASLDEGGLQDITVLAPNDGGFYKAAQEFGYDELYDDNYNEEAIFDYLVAVVGSLPAEGEPTLAEKLQFPLTYHVILNSLSFEELADTDGGEIFTLCSCPITFDLKKKEKLVVQDVEKPYSNIIYDQSDMKTSNGYVQVIDRMLVPISIPTSA